VAVISARLHAGQFTSVTVTVSNGAGHLFRRPVDLDLQMGPAAIPDEIPVNTGYLMRICEIS